MSDTYHQSLTPFQKEYLKSVSRKRWLKWSMALVILNTTPFVLMLLGNTDLFNEMTVGDAFLEILTYSLYLMTAFLPIMLILWGYLLYLLFSKIIPLQRDILKGQRLLQLIPADKYMMQEFNQFFIRTSIKQWTFQQIPEGIPLIFETAPRSAIYLGLRSATENEVILTEQPESIY
jgi:hypothetical protein